MSENICIKNSSRSREYRSKKESLASRIIAYVNSNESVTRRDIIKKFDLSDDEFKIQVSKIKSKYGIALF